MNATSSPDSNPGLERRRRVVIAGHDGDRQFVRDHVADPEPGVREAALGALDRLDDLDADTLRAAFDDPAPMVRRRAALLAATRRELDVIQLLHDDDSTVVEAAAWTCGEHEQVDDPTLERLIELVGAAADPLVRESAAAALGAIGDVRGLPAILAACADKPNVRRRAVLALAPFEGPDVEAALELALHDRDWQVRQAAEDITR